MNVETLIEKVLGAALEVHRRLGPGLVEAVYHMCLEHELALRSLVFERQVWLPVTYRGHRIHHALRLDYLVEEQLVLELRTVPSLTAHDEAQLRSYLLLAGKPAGLLVNFHALELAEGVRRIDYAASVVPSGALVSWE